MGNLKEMLTILKEILDFLRELFGKDSEIGYIEDPNLSYSF